MKFFLTVVMSISLALSPYSTSNAWNKDYQKALKGGIGYAILGGSTLIATGSKLCATWYGCAGGIILIGMGGSILSYTKTELIPDLKDATQIGCEVSTTGCAGSEAPPPGTPNHNLTGGGPASGKQIKPFENKYVKLDPRTKTIKDKIANKTYSFDDFKSPESMAAAGISKSAIDQAMAEAKKIEAQVMKEAGHNALAGEGADSFGGGGAGGGHASIVVTEDGGIAGHNGGLPGFASRNPVTSRDPAALAGLSKDYHGHPIGVSAGDIFMMMSRRYKLKEKQDHFFAE